MPDRTAFNVTTTRGNTSYGAQVVLPHADISKRVFGFTTQTRLGPSFWFKSSMNSQSQVRATGFWSVRPGCDVVGTLETGGEGFSGYMAYPFNFGLSLKLSA